jgi:hypothetical protein
MNQNERRWESWQTVLDFDITHKTILNPIPDVVKIATLMCF